MKLIESRGKLITEWSVIQDDYIAI